MSQNNNLSSVNQILPSTPPNGASDSNDGWAKFDTFTNTIPETTTSNTIEDDWADCESNTEPSVEDSNNKQTENINKNDEDDFGDYGEVQTSPSPIDTFTTEQIESLISTCFPLESSTDTDNFLPFPLPTFTTFKDPIKQLPCFKHSLSLWNLLSTISNDPIGIQYQWRKSNSERLFHQALGVKERFRPKTIPIISETSSAETPILISENKISPQTVDPDFDWKKSGLENPLTDTDSSSPSANSIKIETDVFDVNKTLDLDYYIPPIQTSTTSKEESMNSSTTIHRNNSPILQPHSIPIKTVDLFPCSTTVLNEEVKPVVVTVPNFSFMNPKALMISSQLNTESTPLY